MQRHKNQFINLYHKTQDGKDIKVFLFFFKLLSLEERGLKQTHTCPSNAINTLLSTPSAVYLIISVSAGTNDGPLRYCNCWQITLFKVTEFLHDEWLNLSVLQGCTYCKAISAQKNHHLRHFSILMQVSSCSMTSTLNIKKVPWEWGTAKIESITGNTYNFVWKHCQ